MCGRHGGPSLARNPQEFAEMLWFAEIAGGVDPQTPQVINDSKTPSGRVHVGALRGVILHDAVFRALKNRSVPARYLFGVDDYDPLDELPAGQAEFFMPYLGAPLCNVPAPAGSLATDMSEHFIGEFFDVFRELGVEAEHYRMRDQYRSGKMNESIHQILSHADVVRRVYKEVSGSEKSEHWHPFQAICERCGRVGTTEVVAYDGKEVEYHCRPRMMKHGKDAYVKGCELHSKVSPFDGKGKLPWKLEWVAKWRIFGVTIEGAGKDHTTKGGSRDVSAACLDAIFGEKPPLNIPYEFFLAEGKKMSSSKGVGTSARDMADFLAPEVLRYLILRTQPKSPVDFPLVPDPKTPGRLFLSEDFIVKLFNDFDRLHKRVYTDPKVNEEEKELYRLCEVTNPADAFDANFQLVLTFVQMPHVNLLSEMESRKGGSLTDHEKAHLEARAKSARYWLDHFARDEEKFHLQDTLPARAAELGQAQKAFLHQLAAALPAVTKWDDETLQATTFDVARLTPIALPQAFKAIYRTLFDREQGPRAGAIMAILDKDFLIKRFTELPYEQEAFWKETAISAKDHLAQLEKEKTKIASIKVSRKAGTIIDFEVTHLDAKVHIHRVEDAQIDDHAARVTAPKQA
jgi:lysyl-tRNA synthetase class 1